MRYLARAALTAVAVIILVALCVSTNRDIEFTYLPQDTPSPSVTVYEDGSASVTYPEGTFPLGR